MDFFVGSIFTTAQFMYIAAMIIHFSTVQLYVRLCIYLEWHFSTVQLYVCLCIYLEWQLN